MTSAYQRVDAIALPLQDRALTITIIVSYTPFGGMLSMFLNLLASHKIMLKDEEQ